MVYTEYFVRGTEPIDYCPLHSQPFNAVATSGTSADRPVVAATSGEGPPPAFTPIDHLREPAAPRPDAHLGDTAPVAAVATSPAPTAAASPTTMPAARKRGFWGRVFRR
jgi:hypothetical protein